MIQSFTSLCTEEDYPAFAAEAKLSFSFTDTLYESVENRRTLADSVYSSHLELKKLPYIAVYSASALQHSLKESVKL